MRRMWMRGEAAEEEGRWSLRTDDNRLSRLVSVKLRLCLLMDFTFISSPPRLFANNPNPLDVTGCDGVAEEEKWR
ncbi:hypothetical protein PBY51_007408 [Eleginops maclovinus]|uniref:Uncharacterized protein n=1 Tax=Eleginops maclovinus TaxID=56733 RepID=A0AAN8AH29_ELEMC|nr:hypothetical protein PBY51_007408 [Eleginops maclovinus]